MPNGKFFIAAVGLGYFLNLPASALSSFDDAVTDYNGRRYSAAINKLRDSVQRGQADARTHYYLGLSYQGLSQIASARQEYNWVYKNSKDEHLKYNAYQALLALDRWSKNRAYAGQGNNFQRYSLANSYNRLGSNNSKYSSSMNKGDPMPMAGG